MYNMDGMDKQKDYLEDILNFLGANLPQLGMLSSVTLGVSDRGAVLQMNYGGLPADSYGGNGSGDGGISNSYLPLLPGSSIVGKPGSETGVGKGYDGAGYLVSKDGLFSGGKKSYFSGSKGSYAGGKSSYASGNSGYSAGSNSGSKGKSSSGGK